MRGLSKWWQRWVLDAFLNRPPPLFAAVITIFLTVFAVGFWCAHWLDQVDLAMYRSLSVFSDNIKGENLLGKLCGVLPIDVVYTWVNGSDPLLIEGLQGLSQGIEGSCLLSDCLPAPYITLLNNHISKRTFASIPSVLEVAHTVITHRNKERNYTMLRVSSEKQVQEVIETLTLFVGNQSSIRQAFWTSDVGGGWGTKQKHAALVTGAAGLSNSALLETLFPRQENIISVCKVLGSGQVRVVECQKEELVPGLLLSSGHLQGSKSSLRMHQAMLMLETDKQDHAKEVDPNRFQDNEELRYSLRSLEQFAPWVRRIFLVTNGQIPHWLNLDHPRLTIVTHKDIFPNVTHLPTYSSPAIESHIHRIPGLSDHFLYLNDDVMVGEEVWPEDFYSPSEGYKVHLSWLLPECSSGCPSSWLGDGYCDASCNTSVCDWDGGDCGDGAQTGGDFIDPDDNHSIDDSSFCAPSCSDMWLGDHYCDQSCNTLDCGFDGGDCGTDKVNQMHHLPLPTTSNVTYSLPQGVVAAYMNLSSVLEPGSTVEGWHTQNAGVRTVIANTAQGILFVLIKRNVTATIRLDINISQKNPVKYFVTLKYNTYPPEPSNVTEHTVNLPLSEIKNFTFDRLTPNIVPKNTYADKHGILSLAYVDPEASNFSASVVSEVAHLEERYREGDLTLLGLKWKKGSLVSEALQSGAKRNLIYYKESDWPPVVKVAENDTNSSSLSSLTHLVKLGNNTKNTTKGNDIKPLNVNSSDHRVGLRALLWAENTEERNDDNGEPPRKQIFESRKRTNTNHKAKERNTKEIDSENLETRVGSHTFGSRKHMNTNHEGKGRNKEIGLETFAVSLSSQTFESRKGTKTNNKVKERDKKEIDNGTLATYLGSLPWEKLKLFPENGLQEERTEAPSVPRVARRHLLDMFGESLLHVNRIYNSEYGFQTRRVPAHMPHIINKGVMESLQEKFKHEFELTSSHKIRQANDMQYAFSYFFYLMSEKKTRTPTEVFQEYDTDVSGTLSDREIRTFLTFVHDLPLHYDYVQQFHDLVKNCTANYHTEPVPTPAYERYADSDLPTVSLELMLKCEPLTALLKKLEKVNKYKYTHKSDEDVHFKMVTSNVSTVVHMLDEVRKSRRKFICLNSNLDPNSKNNDLIHALVQDTYESLFPLPSSFELPLNYRNRFLYVDELVAWRKWRDFVRALIYASLASLVFLTLVNFFSTELESLRRRWCRRRRRQQRECHGSMKV